MADEKSAQIVAQKARETFYRIRDLRKTEPQFTRAQKDELERKIKEEQTKWWEEVKGFMVKME
jgi:hypothetical protein